MVFQLIPLTCLFSFHIFFLFNVLYSENVILYYSLFTNNHIHSIYLFYMLYYKNTQILSTECGIPFKESEDKNKINYFLNTKKQFQLEDSFSFVLIGK